MELIRDGIYPLALGQRHLVQAFEVRPKSRLPLRRVYKLQKDFNKAAFTESVRYLINKHPSLRLRLFRSNTGWVQKFMDQSAVISYNKVRGITKTFRLTYGMLQIAEDIKPALNLEKDSPVRASIFKINNEYYLSLSIDHIAVDEMSFGIFERELADCYQKALSGNLIPSLPSETFKKFILNELKNSNKERGNLNYWHERFQGIHFLNKPKSKKPLAIAGNYFRIFENEEYKTLIELTTEFKYSILTIAVAIHLLMIYESRKINDIILAIPFSNRIKDEDKFTVANIVMPLQVRFKWNPEESILKIINGIRETLFNAIIHSQYDPLKLLAFLVQNNGGRVSITMECNFILDEDSLVYPNVLFIERLDSKTLSKIINCGGFNIHARQYDERVLFRLTWDEEFWSIKPESMGTLFDKTYNLICAAIKK